MKIKPICSFLAVTDFASGVFTVLYLTIYVFKYSLQFYKLIVFCVQTSISFQFIMLWNNAKASCPIQ